MELSSAKKGWMRQKRPQVCAESISQKPSRSALPERFPPLFDHPAKSQNRNTSARQAPIPRHAKAAAPRTAQALSVLPLPVPRHAGTCNSKSAGAASWPDGGSSSLPTAEACSEEATPPPTHTGLPTTAPHHRVKGHACRENGRTPLTPVYPYLHNSSCPFYIT